MNPASNAHPSSIAWVGSPASRETKIRQTQIVGNLCPAILLTVVDSLAFFDKRLQPAENANPSLIMIGRCFWNTGKSFVTYPHQRARPNFLWTAMLQAMNLLRLKLPTHDGLERTAPTSDPGVD